MSLDNILNKVYKYFIRIDTVNYGRFLFICRISGFSLNHNCGFICNKSVTYYRYTLTYTFGSSLEEEVISMLHFWYIVNINDRLLSFAQTFFKYA